MADVIFYEKPGCISNTRQKQLLQNSGHSLTVRNLLYAPWTSSRLLAYFQNLPVSEWFNQSAPQITSGKLDPNAINKDEAIYRMLAEPILIRRPLMEVEGRKVVGFDADFIDELIGLDKAENIEGDLESCSRV